MLCCDVSCDVCSSVGCNVLVVLVFVFCIGVACHLCVVLCVVCHVCPVCVVFSVLLSDVHCSTSLPNTHPDNHHTNFSHTGRYTLHAAQYNTKISKNLSHQTRHYVQCRLHVVCCVLLTF